MALMDAQPQLVMTFGSLDEAESALDWIGVDFADADGGFEGSLEADDRELLDIALGDPETPDPVRDLAAGLMALLDAQPDGGVAWRVGFAG
jgi:hypothetical protein